MKRFRQLDRYTGRIVAVLTLSLTTVAFSGPTRRTASTKPNVARWPGETRIEKLEKGVVTFSAPTGRRAPDPLQTQVPDAELIGTLLPDAPSSAPYLILSGKTCTGCPESRKTRVAGGLHDEKMLYLIRADGAFHTKFVYPGKVREPKSKRLLLDARAFFGKCLRGRGSVLVFFQKEKVDRRRYLQQSVFVAEASESGLKENLLVRRRPKIRDTLRRVRRKECEEIKGIDRMMAGRPGRK